MRKYSVYIGILIIGIGIGYVLFGKRAAVASEGVKEHKHTEKEQMWTCSMHPQIMQPEPGDCPICGMDLIPADQTTDGLTSGQFRMTENAMALANIETSVIGKDALTEGAIKLSGVITENEEENAVQTAHFSGRIEKLYVKYTGETVRNGQLLALIYSPELVAAQQELLTAVSLKSAQPALYEAVKRKLASWKLTATQIEEIERSGKVKSNFPVYANVSGVVTEKNIEVGDHLKEGQAMFRIANLNTVWGAFDAYENMISSLKIGQKVIVRTHAFPEESLEATVSFINPVLDKKTRTVTVRVLLKNKDERLKPGMFIEGAIKKNETAKQGGEAILIPKSAVLWTGKRSVVYVKPEHKQAVFEMREVVLGALSGDDYIVISGVSEGEEIVVNGTFTVDASAQLQGKYSMMNRKEEKKKEENIITPVFSEVFQQEMQQIINGYIQVKDALIKGDYQLIKDAGVKNLEVFDNVKTTDFSEKEKGLVSQLKKKTARITTATALGVQQKEFKKLSDAMIEITEGFDQKGRTLFVQFCPMGDENRGAKWLSYEDEVMNPYFAGEMLRCGSVVDTLQKQ